MSHCIWTTAQPCFYSFNFYTDLRCGRETEICRTCMQKWGMQGKQHDYRAYRCLTSNLEVKVIKVVIGYKVHLSCFQKKQLKTSVGRWTAWSKFRRLLLNLAGGWQKPAHLFVAVTFAACRDLSTALINLCYIKYKPTKCALFLYS